MTAAIWTVGHSNHAWEDFLALLAAESIELLADVRRFPGSRKHPQFNQDPMRQALAAAGVAYEHLPELGGRRGKPLPDSLNTAWRVEAFNAYADFMQTPEFAAGFERLMRLAHERRTAFMCSEALPWRCHRRLIADRLLVEGWQVFDIMSRGKSKPHELPPFAKVSGHELTYPGGTLFPQGT